MSAFWKNILLIIGATVGAGIFSLPQLLNKIGIVWFIVFLLGFSYLTYRLNWFYFRVIKSVKGNHQFSGYVERVLGTKWGRAASFVHLFSTYGALIAFVLIGGEFLGKALGITDQLGSQLFFVLAMVFILTSGKKSENIDVLFSLIKGVMFLIIAFLCFSSFGLLSSISIVPITIPFESMGAFIFALSGFSIIPELHKEKDEGKSIFTAQLAILLIYVIFTLAVSPYWQGSDFAFSNPVISRIFSVTGFISVFTAYLLLSWVGKDIYREDLKVKERFAIGLISVVPFLAIVIQFGSFLSVLSLTGGVFLAATGILICWMYSTVHPGKNRVELAVIQLVFLSVMIFEIVSFIRQ